MKGTPYSGLSWKAVPIFSKEQLARHSDYRCITRLLRTRDEGEEWINWLSATNDVAFVTEAKGGIIEGYTLWARRLTGEEK